jgi:hypothetical protein
MAPRSWGWWTEQNYDNFNSPELTSPLEQAHAAVASFAYMFAPSANTLGGNG